MCRMSVELREVTAANWRACAAIQARPDQSEFVNPVSYYLCLCHYGQLWQPLAVLQGADVVGFVMWARDPDDGSHWIGGVTVDAGRQGTGLGRALITALVEWLRTEQGATSLALSYLPANTVARKLYASVGFTETGEMEDDELVARLTL